MGVHMIENDPDSLDVEDLPHIYCHQHCSSAANSTSISTKTEADVLNHNRNIKCHTEYLRTPNCLKFQQKELIGNCKEFRIENNKNNLRIIGNGNRIRIIINTGNIEVIGNNTRLKIVNNSGHIKYTGNAGRICFGSESSQQFVDYIGYNGILKVINAVGLTAGMKHTKIENDKLKSRSFETLSNNTKISTDSKCSSGIKHNNNDTNHNNNKNNNNNLNNSNNNKYSNSSDYKNASWAKFNNLLKKTTTKNLNYSMPNINVTTNNNNNYPKSCTCQCECKLKTNTAKSEKKNLIKSYGHIVINNSVNITI